MADVRPTPRRVGPNAGKYVPDPPPVEVLAVSSKALLYDLSKIDFNHVVADIEAIRRVNPQRYEMEQLTAVVYESLEEQVCVGYKDTSVDEFWVRGHMPGMPLMPGVIMLEAIAQISAYFAQKYDCLGAKMIGFGGLEDVRFRDPVIPGDRLILISKLLKSRRGRMIICQFQGVVGQRVVVEGVLKGIPIPADMLPPGLATA
jgi:3-hydroxyacyl-[acyl-carrier-protein] dehydratase